ncbi:MAG: glycoside hydrolase family 1 protein [Chryseotalea sp.]|jgi:beta-glucosidase
MKKFPDTFQFGTSTSAYQIETPFEHDWVDVNSLDGHIFNRTTDHEKLWESDVELIATLAPHYRMSLMWSKLQRTPYAPLDAQAVAHYHQVLQALKAKNVSIMMVLHHFTNPIWFSKVGGWEKAENIFLWLDFVTKLVNEFGGYVSSWNTFNEPNVYACFGWIVGKFPPFKNNILLAGKVVKHMGLAHDKAYDIIKSKFPEHPVGISHNTAVFTADSFLGKLPARLSDLWFMEFVPGHFEKADFFGMSYYARINHDPLPVTMITTPEKLKASGKDHDDMWEYYPEGLRENVLRYWKKYQKPIIITENGICTKDDTKRIKAITDYLSILHQLIADGIPIKGYYYWSTWDNFEWALGPTYQFGLATCDPESKERNIKPSGSLYARIAHSCELHVPNAHQPR